MANNCPRCGAGLRGWERICSDCKGKPLAGGAAAHQILDTIRPLPAAPIPIAPVTGNAKPKQLPVTDNAITIKPVTGNADRQAELKRKRIAAGIVRLELWAHIDDHASIKSHAANLSAKRTK